MYNNLVNKIMNLNVAYKNPLYPNAVSGALFAYNITNEILLAWTVTVMIIIRTEQIDLMMSFLRMRRWAWLHGARYKRDEGFALI